MWPAFLRSPISSSHSHFYLNLLLLSYLLTLWWSVQIPLSTVSPWCRALPEGTLRVSFESSYRQDSRSSQLTVTPLLWGTVKSLRALVALLTLACHAFQLVSVGLLGHLSPALGSLKRPIVSFLLTDAEHLPIFYGLWHTLSPRFLPKP